MSRIGYALLLFLALAGCHKLEVPDAPDPIVDAGSDQGRDAATDARPLTEPPDHAPRVLSVSPANGAVDVAIDTPIVVTFSEPVRWAHVAPSIRVSEVETHGEVRVTSQAWNEAHTVLTAYAALLYGTLDVIDLADGHPPASIAGVKAKQFDVRLDPGDAKDAAGKAFEFGAAWSFRTKRRVLHRFNLIANDWLEGNVPRGDTSAVGSWTFLIVGDDYNDRETRAFMTFDVHGLPPNVDITRGSIASFIWYTDGEPFTKFGDLGLASLQFKSKWDGYDAPVFSSLVVIDAAHAPSPRRLSVEPVTNAWSIPPAPPSDLVDFDVTPQVKDDYANLADRSYLSQYRLQFPKEAHITSTDRSPDRVLVFAGAGTLVNQYLTPVAQLELQLKLGHYLSEYAVVPVLSVEYFLK